MKHSSRQKILEKLMTSRQGDAMVRDLPARATGGGSSMYVDGKGVLGDSRDRDPLTGDEKDKLRKYRRTYR